MLPFVVIQPHYTPRDPPTTLPVPLRLPAQRRKPRSHRGPGAERVASMTRSNSQLPNTGKQPATIQTTNAEAQSLAVLKHSVHFLDLNVPVWVRYAWECCSMTLKDTAVKR